MCDKQVYRNPDHMNDTPAINYGGDKSTGDDGAASRPKRRQLSAGSFLRSESQHECLPPMNPDDRSALLAWIRAKREGEMQRPAVPGTIGNAA